MVRLLLLSTVWLTANILLGYIVAPVLFSVLDKVSAGKVMGVLLEGLYFFDLTVILFMIFGLMMTQSCVIKREGLLIASAILVGINQWFLAPKMTWLKIHGIDDQILGLSFAQWHGISQSVFLLTLICFSTWCYLFFKSKTSAKK